MVPDTDVASVCEAFQHRDVEVMHPDEGILRHSRSGGAAFGEQPQGSALLGGVNRRPNLTPDLECTPRSGQV
jgi:hypothetical protein